MAAACSFQEMPDALVLIGLFGLVFSLPGRAEREAELNCRRCGFGRFVSDLIHLEATSTGNL